MTRVGAKVIDRLAQDLKAAFSDMWGFSPRNLKHMRALAQAWPSSEYAQQPAAQLPWFHLCTLLDRAKDPAVRDLYASKAPEHGWPRNVLAMQIDTQAHAWAGAAVTNFDARLPPHQSDLAREVLKDPYIFDSLGLTEDAQERDIEQGLENTELSTESKMQTLSTFVRAEEFGQPDLLHTYIGHLVSLGLVSYTNEHQWVRSPGMVKCGIPNCQLLFIRLNGFGKLFHRGCLSGGIADQQ